MRHFGTSGMDLYVLDEHPPDSMRERLEEAVRSCPTQAISLADE